MNYIFIANGRKDYEHVKDELSRQLQQFKITYHLYITTGPGDATRYVKIYCDLHPNEEVCFVACGGSGICNEVASGIIGEKNKSMAIMAYGTTNDFIKYYPGRDFQNLKKILLGETIAIDAIRVNDNYAINVCSLGFDTVAAEEANYQIEAGGKHPYQLGVLKAILTGRYNRVSVTADGERINKNWMLLCTLANGKYVGGQYLCAPNAVNDDGLIELCLLKVMTLVQFFLLIGLYRRGSHLLAKTKKIIYRRVRHVDIESPHIINVCLDGELLMGTHFSVDILPKSLRLVLPQQDE